MSIDPSETTNNKSPGKYRISNDQNRQINLLDLSLRSRHFIEL